MLKLEDFVAETLKQIINGVRAAQSHAKECGAEVSPKELVTYGRDGMQTAVVQQRSTGRPIDTITFDVAVTASSGDEAHGGVGVFVMGVSLGGKKSTDSRTEATSRITFAVPMFLPVQD